MTDLQFMPLSALTGYGLKERIPKDVCPWYEGPALLEYLDGMQVVERKLKAPFMMPISTKYKVCVPSFLLYIHRLTLSRIWVLS